MATMDHRLRKRREKNTACCSTNQLVDAQKRIEGGSDVPLHFVELPR